MRRLRYVMASVALLSATVLTAQQIHLTPAADTAAAPHSVINSPYLYMGWGNPPAPTTIRLTAKAKAASVKLSRRLVISGVIGGRPI